MVDGEMMPGVSGELLAVGAPVKACALPEVDTFANGSTNVKAAGPAPLLETFP